MPIDVDEHSLQLLEFDRVVAAVAGRAASEAGAAALCAARPIRDPEARHRENALLAEAIHRGGEPGRWVLVGRGDLGVLLARDGRTGAPGESSLDGPGLLEVLSWLEAARETRLAWAEAGPAERHPLLAARARELPGLDALRDRLREALDDEGRVRDSASPALKRARAGLAEGERELERSLARWAREFGSDAYVTRHADRFVALVPAAGFPRRRGIVHDVSGSGHSLFVEPVEACEANNHLIEMAAVAREEERRILRELAEAVRAAADELSRLEEILVHLDSLSARGAWAVELNGIALDPGGDRLDLRAARHPLLAMREGGTVIPLDLVLDSDRRILLVSGPNMGGKTVLLKTVGLAACLAHAAFPVPAGEGSAVPALDRILVDVGDEQSLEQGLSTFAAHLRRLSEMAEHAGERAMVLCDELGAGTDPEEGTALGRALLERFVERRAWGVVTTHLGGLKRAAGERGGIASGSLEFDTETLTPRYRFLPGIPGASRALAIAERLGFDPEIVARARAITPEESRMLERLLEELQGLRQRLEDERAAAAAARDEAEKAFHRHRDAEAAARKGLEESRRRLTRESDALLARVRELWQTVQREARRVDKTRAEAERMRVEIAAVEQVTEDLQRAGEQAVAGFGGGSGDAGVDEAGFRAGLVPGARVRVRDLDVEAEILSGPDPEGRVELRRGGWTIQSHVSKLAPPAAGGVSGSGGPAPRAGAVATWNVPEEAVAVEVDLRGMEVEAALSALDTSLDRGVLSGLHELRIIHGVGRGVLRAAVEHRLKEHPQVASSRLGGAGEGGRGVTVARLR